MEGAVVFVEKVNYTMTKDTVKCVQTRKSLMWVQKELNTSTFICVDLFSGTKNVYEFLDMPVQDLRKVMEIYPGEELNFDIHRVMDSFKKSNVDPLSSKYDAELDCHLFFPTFEDAKKALLDYQPTNPMSDGE